MDELDVERAALEAPDGLALLAEGEQFTWRELALRARAMMREAALTSLGPEQWVAVQASNRVGTVALLAGLLARRQGVLLLHPRLTAPERDALTERVPGARVLLDDELSSLERASRSPSAAASSLIAPHARPDEAPAALLFTSGSSGTPRGALLSRRAFRASAAASERNLGWLARDRWLLALPLCHVGGLSVFTRCLAARRPVVLQPRFEPEAVEHALRTQGVTLVSVVPTMLRALLERPDASALSLARAVLVGGAHLGDALRATAAAQGVLALATYGMTEACSQLTTQALRPAREVELGVGRLLHGVELRVCDASGAAVSQGAEGLIEVRGPNLFSGYLGDPAREPEHWFATGDWGALGADGTLSVLARRSDLVLSGGENVYPTEVEQALEGVPGVAAAMVFGVPDERWGERVAALLVPRGAWDEPAVYAALRSRLAGHRVPRAVAVVDALPTLPSGKLDRRGARARFGPSLRAWRTGE